MLIRYITSILAVVAIHISIHHTTESATLDNDPNPAIKYTKKYHSYNQDAFQNTKLPQFIQPEFIDTDTHNGFRGLSDPMKASASEYVIF